MTDKQSKSEIGGSGSQPNEGLSGLVSGYWEDRESPGFRGYGEESAQERRKKESSSDGKRKSHHEKKHNRKKDRREGRSRRLLRTLGIILLVIILIAAAFVLVMGFRGKKSAIGSTVAREEVKGPDDARLGDGGKTVVYKGNTYCYNTHISTILCIGIDKEEYNETGTYGKGGQADTLFLIAYDNENGKSVMIPISRNTMAQIDEYNEDGTYWRQNKIQIALAYAYGDGREKSCENVAKAVSRLLYGMPVNDYITLDLSAIASLNDAVGGVPVTVLEDMTQYDPVLKEGAQITLKGQQAVSYVRSRKTEGYDLKVDNNAPRMERQKQYLDSFLNQAVIQTKKDLVLPLNLYRLVKEDMITSITPSEVMYYARMVKSRGVDNSIVSIPGKARKGEYTEVYVDDDSLYQIILDTFYKKVS